METTFTAIPGTDDKYYISRDSQIYNSQLRRYVKQKLFFDNKWRVSLFLNRGTKFYEVDELYSLTFNDGE